MKKYLINSKIVVSVFFYFGMFTIVYAQNIYNSSASVNIPTGIIVSAGSFSNTSGTISNAGTLILVGSLTNTIAGTITFENGSSLVQTAGTTNSNTGNIIYKRNTSIMSNNFDFTYWGSPVAGQTLGGIWMAVNNNDTFYSWTSPTNTWTPRLSNHVMAPALGYVARSRNGTSGTDHAGVTTTYNSGISWQSRFFGVPNNGDYTVNVNGVAPFTDNLLSNPYPSAIDLIAFRNDASNSAQLSGNFYFWTHNNNISSNSYNASDYAIFNVALNASTGTAIVGTPAPDRYVDAGQGFFAEGTATGTVTFKNSHRVQGNNNAFYRVNSNTTTQQLIESHKIWLNLTNDQGLFKQQLLTYTEGATMGFDPTMDAKTFDGNAYIDFYSTAASEKLTIQSRAIPFATTDLVPLGFKTTVAGDYKIAIDRKDGLFDTQTVYLQDNLLNTDHNLSLAPYNFSTASGTFNSRFVVKYSSTLLGIDNPNMLTNYVNVYKNNGAVVVNSSLEKIEKILIFDLLGRKVFEQTNLDTNKFVAENVTVNEQVLIVKVHLKNGVVNSTKVVY